MSSRLPVHFFRRATGALLLLLAAGCAERETGDPRADRAALARVLAADDAAARAMDPALEAIGTGHAGEALAALEGQVSQLAIRAERRARAARVQTKAGRRLRNDLVRAASERKRVIDLAAEAARSRRPEDLLEVVRAARALEERVADLDLAIEALPTSR